MTDKQQWALVALVVAVLGSAVVGGALLFRHDLFRLQLGARAPVFSAVTLDTTAKSRTLSDYSGRVVLLNVWATDCPPCREEMPSLEELHREFRDRGLSVVAVSVDAPGSEQIIRDFVKEYGLTFDVLYDPENRIKQLYQTQGVPETFVIDRDGVLVRKEWGARNWASLDNRSLMAQLVGASHGAPGEPPGAAALDNGR